MLYLYCKLIKTYVLKGISYLSTGKGVRMIELLNDIILILIIIEKILIIIDKIKKPSDTNTRPK